MEFYITLNRLQYSHHTFRGYEFDLYFSQWTIDLNDADFVFFYVDGFI